MLENERGRIKHVRQRAWIILRFRRDLGEHDVTGGLDEGVELTVRHWRLVHPERAYRDPMNRSLFGIMLIRSHGKRAALDENHSGL